MNLIAPTVVTHALVYGLLLSASLSVIVLVSLWVNAEMWLHDAPKEIQEKYGPISAKAKQQRIWVALAVFSLVIGIPWWALAQLPTATGVTYTFGTVFTTLIVMFMLFNLVDLLLLDWLIIETWRPRFLRTSRLSQFMEKRYYWFHFVGFCKGSVGLTLASLLVAGIIAVIV